MTEKLHVWYCDIGYNFYIMLLCGNVQSLLPYINHLCLLRTAHELFFFLLFLDVAFNVGGDSGVNYIVLQVHYRKVDRFLGELIDFLPWGFCIFLSLADLVSH